MIPKSKSKAQLKQLVQKAASSELASIGSIVFKITAITKNPDSTATDLKETIEVDPPLSAKVLRRANSAQYGISRSVTSIQEAIVFMGFNAVKELALSLKVSDVFKDETIVNGYSKKMLWKHSLAVAMCAKSIYRREYSEKGETIYSAGLLHDIGLIVEDQYAHENFELITGKVLNEEVSLVDAEKEVQGFDHCRIARDLTGSWKLPPDLVAAVTYHHQPLWVDPIYAKEAYTLFIADFLCSKYSVGYVGQADLDHDAFERCCTLMNLEPLALEIIIEDVIQELAVMEEREEL